MSELYICICFFIFGSVMGSFYNVLGYRLPNGMSIVSPPSHCPDCNHRLMPIELIPIISYIIQGGKCKHCHKKIPIFYPIFETLTGLMFVASYLVFGMTPELLTALVFSSILLIIILSDTKYMIIPDEVLLFGIVFIFTQKLVMGSIIYNLVLDAVIPFVLIFLIKQLGNFLFKKESLGDGDIKLMLVLGLALGWKMAILSIFVAAFLALPAALGVLIVKKVNMIPFGPFLSIAALLIYFTQINMDWLLNLLTNGVV